MNVFLTTRNNEASKTYIYFVSYIAVTGTRSGYGRNEVPISGPIESIEDIRAIEQYLKKVMNMPDSEIMVQHYQILRVE